MWLADRQGQLWAVYTIFIWNNIVAASPALLPRGCDGNPYCVDASGKYRWHNDCGLERPSQDLYEEHKEEDVIWFRGLFNQFKDQKAEKEVTGWDDSFGMWFAKRFAPDHPPSSLICDGLNSCIVRILHSNIFPEMSLTSKGTKLQRLGPDLDGYGKAPSTSCVRLLLGHGSCTSRYD
jgi:hypothetical protein